MLFSWILFSWIWIILKHGCIERHNVSETSWLKFSATLKRSLRFCFPFGTLGISLAVRILGEHYNR